MTYSDELIAFVTESNRIEGIHRAPTGRELLAHETFLALDEIEVVDLEAFVYRVAGAELRRKPGMDVRIGNHIPRPGGPEIAHMLAVMLTDIAEDSPSPYKMHCAYETLHPFTDGNGRSGRVLWAWMMPDPFALPFLHRWYYQSLDALR